jgi:hypothetical protein
MMIRPIALAILLLAAPMVSAQDLTIQRPAGCAARVTLFYTQCVAMTLMTCAGDDGPYLRTEVAEDGAVRSVLLQTMDYRRIAEGGDANISLVGDPEASKPLPVMDLGPTNPSLVHDIRLSINFRGLQKPASFVGTLTYLGPLTLRSGDVIEEAALDMIQALPPPMPPVPGKGSYYIDRISGFAVEGQVKFAWPGKDEDERAIPIDLVHAGEAGFDQLTPIGGCDVISALSPEREKVHL